jgi:hypothetical protein
MQEKLELTSKSHNESARRVERAKMILEYSKEVTISAITRKLSTNRLKVERCIDEVLQLGALTSLIRSSSKILFVLI